MILVGNLLVGGSDVRGSNGEIRAVDPSTGETLEPVFGGASLADLDRACDSADSAFDAYRLAPLETRARFLERIADNIMGLGDALIARAMRESGLPRARLEGERGRTCGQLRLFASVVRDGAFLGARIDPAMPDRQPLPRVDLRLQHVPLGPVAVFGASNFPLAFSVAGGDAASALAAGCPVIAKAHSAHPGVSEMVGRAVQEAVTECGLPEGVFSMLFDAGLDIGQGLVADRRIKAVGFTGSRAGGTALMRIAHARAEPIPVYAEMSSINPVILFPHALAARPEATAQAFVASLSLGAGQFCTNPGLVLAVDGPELDAFVEAAASALSAMPAAVMLTPGIHKAYQAGVAAIASHEAVRTVARGGEPDGPGARGQAALFETSGDAFIDNPELQDEIFGAASLVVRCRDFHQVRAILEAMEGQLTAAIHIVEADHAEARAVLPVLERKVGRILVNGFGTGVEVAHAMVHGGPYPSTSDGRSTSVGSLAITRFLRPVSYQDLPQELLPEVLRDANPLQVPRLIDGAPASSVDRAGQEQRA
ncbi:aldehyde dehydrogenase (NADP(+)) [Brevundimonas sp. PAMC22021]|uniref:aldehyde dehydrogenase (NADP(+)) n=1 Tax=Brevundimonas sp. PAMC22021 TaxID=2861285 RepID=UPI001C63627E|nr:aldehyde dehydrogenase (NADP(+)) [Brevundimonas sp. PAMC22021]QYF85934.1 aldehyde dehydrogenase (NADP(+)) [Brevundimonas sp. PAMC22021]